MSEDDEHRQQAAKVVLPFSCLLLVVGIVAVVYGDNNLNDLCSDSFLHLAVWMCVQGAVFIFVGVGAGPLYCFLGNTGLALYLTVLALYGLFELIWTIIGGVILWRDSTECQDLNPSFYKASMAIVIISIIMACCMSVKVKASSNNDDSQA